MAERLLRRFVYNSIVLDDPDPAMNPDEVREFYSAIYPELTQAVIDGPDIEDGAEAYEFRKTVGTKGGSVSVRDISKGKMPFSLSIQDISKGNIQFPFKCLKVPEGGFALMEKVAASLKTADESDSILLSSDCQGMI